MGTVVYVSIYKVDDKYNLSCGNGNMYNKYGIADDELFDRMKELSDTLKTVFGWDTVFLIGGTK